MKTFGSFHLIINRNYLIIVHCRYVCNYIDADFFSVEILLLYSVHKR